MGTDSSFADVSGGRRNERMRVEYVDAAEYFVLKAFADGDSSAIWSETELMDHIRQNAQCRRNDLAAALGRLTEVGDLIENSSGGEYRLGISGQARLNQPSFGIAQSGSPWRLIKRQQQFQAARANASGRVGSAGDWSDEA